VDTQLTPRNILFGYKSLKNKQTLLFFTMYNMVDTQNPHLAFSMMAESYKTNVNICVKFYT